MMSTRLIHTIATTALVLSVCALPAFAASPAAGGQEEGPPNLFAGDIGNAIWTLVIFLVVLTLLGKFAWGPVLSAIQRREQFIRESLEQAKRDRAEAEKRLAEYEAQLQRARDEAAALVEAGHRDAEAARSRIQAVAATEASALLERAKTEIGLAKDNAVKELYGVVADMATDVAGKVLRRSLSEEEHGRLIKASLAEMHEHVDEHGSN